MSSLDRVCLQNAIVEQPKFDSLFGCSTNYSFDGFSSSQAETEQFLDLVSRKATQLFQAGQLVFFDAAIGNDQCHFVALRIALLYKKYQAQRVTPFGFEEERFLTLCLISCICFNKNKKLLANLVGNQLDDKLKPRLVKFLHTTQISKCAKQQLIKNIHEFTCTILMTRKTQESSPLVEELSDVVLKRDLFKGLLTYPKFLGSMTMVHEAEKNGLSFIFKLKTRCPSGIHHRQYVQVSGMNKIVEADFVGLSSLKDSPVIVIEGFATTTSKAKDYLEARNACSNTILARSKECKKSCFVCTPCPTGETCHDFQAQRTRFIETCTSAQFVFELAGADFMAVVQKELCAKYFQKSKEYPLLTSLFNERLERAKAVGLSMESGHTFVVEHVYADLGKHALGGKRLSDTKNEDVVKTRGAICA